jgi:predicted transposase YbfD/YdcC
MVSTGHNQAATHLRYHKGFETSREIPERWLMMQDTILPFDLVAPEEPILIDVDSLYQRFAQVTDQRQRRGKRSSLALILTIAVLAKLAGQDKVEAIAEWARLRAHELNALFRRQRTSMPHPTTWRRILGQAVDPQALTHIVGDVLAAASDEVPARGSILLVLDGKTLRGTIPRGSTRGDHLLAAYLPAAGVVLAQVAVDQNENEISAAPRLLRHLDLTGMVVTGDAMHTQRDLSIQIVEQGGDYLWTVKENQPTLRDDLELLFDPDMVAFAGGAAALDFRTARTIEKAHGRLEERMITVSSLLHDYSDWPYLAQAFRLDYRHTDMVTGETSSEVRYGITSQPPDIADPRKLLAQVRGEWGIETGLHGRRDVTLGEDDAHLRHGQAAHVLAVLNNTVVGLVLKHGYTNLAQARRVLDYLVNKCLHHLCLSWST